MKGNTKAWVFFAEINRVYSISRYPSNIGLLPNGQIPSIEKSKEIFDFAKKIESIFKTEVPEDV